MRFVIFYILFILVLPGATLHAQNLEEKSFTLYSIKEGLSDNRINHIAQDEYGYLWIATWKGLNRFDGSQFLQFYSDSSQNSLPHDFVKQLKCLGKDQLSAYTGVGLHIINPTTLNQRNLLVPEGPLQAAYRESNIQGMAADAEGNIFLLTTSGFYHFNAAGEIVFRYDHYKKEEAGINEMSFGRNDGIIMPEENRLLLATTNGIYVYDISLKKLQHINESDYPLYGQIAPAEQWVHFMHGNSQSFSVIYEGATALLFFDLERKKKYEIKAPFGDLKMKFDWRTKVTRLDDSSYIMISAQKGFYILRYHAATDSYSILPTLYLGNYRCTSAMLDKSNRLWIGTTTGLLQQKRNAGKLEKVTIPLALNPDSRQLNLQMMTIANGKLFAAARGGGVYVFDRNNLQPLKHIDFSNYPQYRYADAVNSLITFGDSVYAGTNGPLIGIDPRSYQHEIYPLPRWEVDSHWIATQYIDAGKTWYVTTSGRNRFYYRRQNEKHFEMVDLKDDSLFNILTPMNIAQDPEGHIWFAGHGGSRFNLHARKTDKLVDSFPKIKNARKEMQGLLFDEQGKMYFGQPENGLIIYDLAQNKFEHLTRSEGLPDNFVKSLFLFNKKLWIGTESGLACYDTETKNIFSFSIADDMPEGPVTSTAFYYDSAHHKLYAGFNNTIVRFSPDSLVKNSLSPSFFIESARVPGSGTIFHPDSSLQLSHRQNSIVLNLASVNFEDAHQQEFAYRIVKNGDEAWQETGRQRNIILSNLSPGEYRLQVKVFIKNNSWPAQVRELAIVVHPPFWQTNWFIILVIALLLSLLYALYRWRIINIRQKTQIDHKLAELEMKGLHAQMNPHFIFNCLNSIKEMILEDQKQAASRYLSKFANLIRTTLEQSRQPFISVRQTLDHLQQYLEMEKIRFEEFSYSIKVQEDRDIDNWKIPPMLAQPLVENAIWHGLRNKEGEKKLAIRFFVNSGQLICEIDDNGIGYQKSLNDKAGLLKTHESLGITNIYERLSVMNEKYNMQCSLSIKDKSELPEVTGSGTIAILKFTTS